MKFSYLKMLNNVWFFYPLKGSNVIIIPKNPDIDGSYFIHFNESLLQVGSIIFKDNSILHFNSKYKNIYISVVNGNTFDINSKQTFLFIKNEFAIESTYSFENNCSSYFFINLKKSKTIFEFKEFINTPLFSGDRFFYRSGINNASIGMICKVISCFSFTKIDYLWHYNIDSLYDSHPSQMAEYKGLNPEVNRIIGVHNGMLWLDIIVRMANSFILGLDAATGSVVHFLQDISLQNEVEYHQMWPEFGLRLPSNIGNTFIDTDRNRLYGFRPDDYYWQVDLNELQPKIKVTSLKHLTHQYNCFFCDLINCGISQQHIYFPVGGIGAKSNGVVVFNKDTMAIDYVLPLDPKQGFGAPNQVKINETHLFVKSKEGILSIFEKTED